MTNPHNLTTDALATLGNILDEHAGRDVIHLAVEPVIAGNPLRPGERVRLDNGKAVTASIDEAIGIVDPFLRGNIATGDRFWLVVNPRTITSLRHVWSHPAFSDQDVSPAVDSRSTSEKWMREWAMKHVSEDYYGDSVSVGEDAAYAFAIEAGHRQHIGPYEDARDYIDSEWWSHWESITGCVGRRGEYFSCSC
jgi:hypothetical protein